MSLIKRNCALVIFWLAVLLMLALRIGPALIGAQVLTGYDMLDGFAPWNALPTADDVHVGNPFITDQIDSQIPAAIEVRNRLSSGDWPLQSNLVQGGASLLAQPSLGIFTPTRWAWLVLPLTIAPGWVKLFEIAFGIGFTYLLCRRLQLTRLASSFGGSVFAFSGFVIAWSGWPQATVVSMIPMLFWAVERFVQERRWRDLVPVAIASAFLLLGGFPIVAAHSFVLCGLYAIMRCFLPGESTSPWRRRIRDLLALGVGVIIGACISMVQLLPFIELTAQGANLEYRGNWSSVQDPTSSWLSLFLSKAPFVGAAFQDQASFIGAVAFVLASLGVLAWIRGGLPKGIGALWILACMFIVGFISFQAIGHWGAHVNGLPILANNPPGRLRAQLALPVAVFVALGVDWLRDVPPRGVWSGPKWLHAGFAWPTAVASVLASAVVLIPLYRHSRVVDLQSDTALRGDLLLAVIPLIAVLILVLVSTVATKMRMIAIVVAGVSIVIQTAGPTSFYWPTADPDEVYPDSQAIDFLAERVGHNQLGTAGLAMRPNVPTASGVRMVNGHGFATASWYEALKEADPTTFSSGGTYSYFAPDRSTIFENSVLDHLGVTFVAAAANEYHLQAGVPTSLPGQILGDTNDMSYDSAPLDEGGARTTVRGPSDAHINGVVIPMELDGEVEVQVSAYGADNQELTKNSLSFFSPGTEIKLPVGLAIPSDASVDRFEVTVLPRHDDEGTLGTVRLSPNSGNFAVLLNTISSEESSYPLVYAGENLLIWNRATALPRVRLTEDATGNTMLSAKEGSLSIQSDTGDLIRVQTTSSESSHLAVAQSLGAGYVARVDGTVTSITEGANGVYTINIPPGSHNVTIEFAPTSLRVGILLTSIGLLALVFLAVAGPIVDHRRNSRSGNNA